MLFGVLSMYIVHCAPNDHLSPPILNENIKQLQKKILKDMDSFANHAYPVCLSSYHNRHCILLLPPLNIMSILAHCCSVLSILA